MSDRGLRLVAPGSLAWLLCWEARLRLRELASGRSIKRLLGTWLVLAVLAHALLCFLMWTTAQRTPQDPQAYRPVVVMLGGVVLLIALMQGMTMTLRTLFESRELSLALTSPLPFSRLLTARVLSLVLATAASPGLMLLPIANCGALLGQPHWLLLYPLTLAVATFGVACALLLIRPILYFASLLAARRLLQLVQFAVPVCFVLWKAARPSSGVDADFQAAPSGLLWLSDAVYGAAAPLAIALLVPALLLVFGRWRIDSAVRSLLLSPEPALLWGKQMPAVGAFRGGLFSSIVLKEWRTTLRDSRLTMSLLGQPMMLAVAFLPVLLSTHEHTAERTAATVALAVYVACQLSQILCNLTLNAELAPDLLNTAPVKRSKLVLAKLLAALLPVWALASMVVLVVALRSAMAAFIAALCIVGGSISIGSHVLLRPRSVDRRSFLRPNLRRPMDVVELLGIVILELAWAAAAYCACSGRWFTACLCWSLIALLMLKLFSNKSLKVVRKYTTND